MTTEALGEFDALAGDTDADPAVSEIGAAALNVVRLVGMEPGRATSDAATELEASP
jgi:hypothetical protein